MFKRAFYLPAVFSIFVMLLLFCVLPSDPLQDPTNASVRLFLKDAGDPIVDNKTTREIGVELQLANLLDSVFITSACSTIDTAFKADSTKIYDTIWIKPFFDTEGQCVLSARATMRDGALKDKSSSLSIRVLAEIVKSSMVPSIVDAPKQVIAGKADTLVFAVDNRTRPDPLTISLTTKNPLDPAVFSIIPTGPDSILIAIPATATSASANIGIITSNGTEVDTAWYPVAIISQNDALWNTTEVVKTAVEGTPLTIDLKPYLSAVNIQGVFLSADIGNVSSDNVWSFTPSWGCASTAGATITATRGSTSLALKVLLNVAAGDVEKPILTLVDKSLDGKKVSASQITIECEATDAGAGIGSVTLTCGTLTVPAPLQHDAIYSGVIAGLVHKIPAQITITATDASRTKNSTFITITVTRDSTSLDAEAPAIVQLTGPKSGERVTEPTGTIGFGVTDNSGVDSVWWTQNGVFKSTVAASDNVFTIGYTLSSFKENVIALHAKDRSVAGNKGFSSITLNYNTKPTAITLTAPTANASGVTKSATFKWSGGDDADGEGATYTVRYGTTRTTLGSMATVSGLTATSTLDYNTTYYWQVTAKSASTSYPDEVQSTVGIFSTEGSLPVISVDPQSQSVEAGQGVTFKVTANGFGTLSYQWRLNGTNISGAIGNSYPISSVTAGMNNTTYDCVVKNEVGEVISKAATLTVTAIPTFTVSFVTDGGLPKPENQAVQRGGKATAPSTNPARSGYRFTGWFELNATHDFYFTQTTIAADLTIYAGWKKAYTVTYHKNTDESGSVPADPTVYDSGAVVTIAGNTGNLTKTDYDFKGWTITPNGSGNVITTVPATSNIELYPKWEIKPITITFKDGTWSETRTVNSGSTIQSCPRLDDKPNKKFVGWSESDICTRIISSTATVTAVWLDKPTYSVTFHSDDTDIPDELITVFEGDIVPNHSTKGYGECWYKDFYLMGDYAETIVYCGWYTQHTGGSLISSNQRVYQNVDLYTHYKGKDVFDHPNWSEGMDCSDYHHHTPADVE